MVPLLGGLATCQEIGSGPPLLSPPPARRGGPLTSARYARFSERAPLPPSGDDLQKERYTPRRRATEAAAEATQARERAERARAWTDDFSARVAAANDRLAKAEQAWREAEGAALNVEGPKDTSPWGLISWAISTGLLLVLNDKRKREAKAVLDDAKRESGEVVARQDDAPFVGTGGRLEPEERLTDSPSRLDALEAALRSAGVLKGA